MRLKTNLTTGGQVAAFPYNGLLTFDPTADPTGTIDDTLPNLRYEWTSSDLTIAQFSGFPLVGADITAQTAFIKVRTQTGSGYILDGPTKFPMSRSWAEGWRTAWSMPEVSNDADWIWYNLEPESPTLSLQGTASHPFATIGDLHLYVAKAGGTYPGRAYISHSDTQGVTNVGDLETDLTGYHPGSWAAFEIRQQYVNT